MYRFFVALFFLSSASLCALSYLVDFEGVEDPSVLKAIKITSQLSSLKKRPPASINALKYRAESDIPEILKVLHAYGYYEATVAVRFKEEEEKTRVIIRVEEGPAYKLGSFTFDIYSKNPEVAVFCAPVGLSEIGIKLGKTALATDVVEAELKLLQLLSECGYPLAQITGREIVADGKTKALTVALKIDAGVLTYFGKTKIEGLLSVHPRLVEQKTSWKEGDIYNSALVEATQKELIDTGLFSSVLITHTEGSEDTPLLPMHIELAESKHKSVNVGISYQTFYGPGITFGWENRNIDGMGRSLRLQGDATKKSHTGIATYFISDFYRIGQDYSWQAEALHEDIRAYSERSYSLVNRLERSLGTAFRFSAAAKVEKLYVTSSVDNGAFLLLEFPLYLRWSTSNNLLNPTQGMAVEYLAIPSLNTEALRSLYVTQRLTYSLYLPVNAGQSIVVAQKLTLGVISSDSLGVVPVPKRYLGGSEEDLRGYHYRTVSPLARHDKPIGGRSAVYYTLEARLRVSEKIGLVPFFDLGNVWLEQIPQTGGKWFKSVGLGVRYFSFMGPFRVDMGFPLDRRKGLDPVYRIFVSIGQMF